MPKVDYNGTQYDSELEVEYAKYLMQNNEVLDYFYNDKLKRIDLGLKRKYTPDFLVHYSDHWEIIETKGYSQYSCRIDSEIDFRMKALSGDELKQYAEECIGIEIDKPVIYKKIKYLKKYGWVDFKFKNPNTIANKRRKKIAELENELKETKNNLKELQRYLNYSFKQRKNKKLTPKQIQFMEEFEKKMGVN